MLPDNTDYLKTIWWPQLVIDPTDATGNTVYFAGGSMITWKSVNGGDQFKGALTLAPIVSGIDVRGSAMAVDANGSIHWLGKARWKRNSDYDIFYGNRKWQPAPGIQNKAYFLEMKRYEKYELTIVPSSPSIDQIWNRASIVFDANAPIITNNYLNTLDLDLPESQVSPLEETNDSYFPVSWSGSDSGSGIAGYTIYVLVNDTLLQTWLNNTTETNANFDAVVGSTYKFYSIAMDNVGQKESDPAGYDAQTTVTVDVESFDLLKEELIVWPNPASGWLFVKLNNAPGGVYVVELIEINGSVIHSRVHEASELQNGLRVNVGNFTPGTYLLRMVFGNRTVSKRLVIR